MSSFRNNLPQSWIHTTLGEIYDVIGGGTPATQNPEYWNGDIPWITSADIEDVRHVNIRKYVTEKGVNESTTNRVPARTLLVATRVGLGKIAISNSLICYSQDLQGLVQNPELIHPEYTLYLLSFELQILKFEARGTTISGITKKQLKDLGFPLPPLNEQKRIVAKIEELFTELDAGIASLHTAQAQLKTYRQSLLKHAFEGKLTAAKNEQHILEDWKLLSFNEITLPKTGLRRGPFGSAIKKSYFVPQGYKVYEQGNAINDDPYRGSYYISEEKFLELAGFEVLPGDLLVSCSGVTLGRIVEIPLDAEKGVINQALLRIRLKRDLINSKYFIHYFRSADFQQKIFAKSQGSAMQNLVSLKEFKEIKINVPSLEEQISVVGELETRFSVIDQLEQSITTALQQAEALRQAILKKAFAGQLVPQDPHDEPASALLARIHTSQGNSRASLTKSL